MFAIAQKLYFAAFYTALATLLKDYLWKSVYKGLIVDVSFMY